MNDIQRALAIKEVRETGTLLSGAKAAGVTLAVLRAEMRRRGIFKKRLMEAKEEGKQTLADRAIGKIQEIAFSPPNKTDRNVLTAAIALANAFEPGFRGTTTVQGKIDHDIRVITAVPRPRYEIIEPDRKLLDNPPRKMLKSKRIEIRDENGEYIGTQTVEEAIEGEVIKESE